MIATTSDHPKSLDDYVKAAASSCRVLILSFPSAVSGAVRVMAFAFLCPSFPCEKLSDSDRLGTGFGVDLKVLLECTFLPERQPTRIPFLAGYKISKNALNKKK